jgi:hypothetical protein
MRLFPGWSTRPKAERTGAGLKGLRDRALLLLDFAGAFPGERIAGYPGAGERSESSPSSETPHYWHTPRKPSTTCLPNTGNGW